MLACTATNIGVGVILLGTLQFLASLLVTERLKTSLQKEHSHFLEKLKWDLKVREQAVKVAFSSVASYNVTGWPGPPYCILGKAIRVLDISNRSNRI